MSSKHMNIVVIPYSSRAVKYHIDLPGDEALCYISDYEGVKNNIAEINSRHQSERIKAYKTEWIPLVQQHIDKWGADMVLPDIRLAYLDVLHGLKMEMFTFPPIDNTRLKPLNKK